MKGAKTKSDKKTNKLLRISTLICVISATLLCVGIYLYMISVDKDRKGPKDNNSITKSRFYTGTILIAINAPITLITFIPAGVAIRDFYYCSQLRQKRCI